MTERSPSPPPPFSLLAEIAGWYGTAAILGAYALSTFGVLRTGDRLYQALNLTGALGVAWVCWRQTHLAGVLARGDLGRGRVDRDPARLVRGRLNRRRPVGVRVGWNGAYTSAGIPPDACPMRAYTSHSQELEAVVAAAELIAKSMEQLRGEEPVAAFLFASTDYNHRELLAALHAHWPDLPLVGGTTDGAISGAGFAHDSVLLTLLTGKGLRARVGLGRSLSKDPSRAVAEALAAAGPKPKLCWTVFAPTTNATAVVRLLQLGVGVGCPVVGGLTGDHREYSRMVEFCGSEVLSDSLPVMFLEGDLLVGCGVGTGWFPIGEPKVVTRAADHWVHEIDGRPALQIFQDYWGSIPASDSLGEYPLAVFPNGPDGDYHLRAVLDADRATGSLRVAGEVVQGAVIKLTNLRAKT